MMNQQLQADGWAERLAAWQRSVDRKWKSWLECVLLRLVQVAAWMYIAAVVAVWLLLRLTGDHWWPTTLVLFGPRTLGLVPLVLLVPLAVVVRARLLLPLAAVTLLYVFGVMGFCLPWPSLSRANRHGDAISVVTCNIHGGAGGPDRLLQLLHRESPDVVAFQECGGNVELPLPDDWHVVREGGLLIASPYPITGKQTWYRLDPPAQWPPLLALYAVIDCPRGPVAVCNIHLTSPHHGITETLDRHTVVSITRAENLRRLNQLRQQESAALSDWLRGLPRVDILLGDFNLPVESRIYRQSWTDYQNAFSEVGFGLGYTRWVKLHNFEYGARIDHILSTDAWTPITCHLGRDIGSDHLPLVATLARDQSPSGMPQYPSNKERPSPHD